MALAFKGDTHHKRAARYLNDLPARASLVTTDYVLDETLTRLRKVAGHAPAVAVGEALRTSTLARTTRLEPQDLERAWDVFKTFRDKDLSFTDCASFAFCERIGVKVAFTFDDDFEQLGFTVEP